MNDGLRTGKEERGGLQLWMFLVAALCARNVLLIAELLDVPLPTGEWSQIHAKVP